VGTPAASAAKPPKVVIAYLDGRRVQGYVFDFSPVREACRVFPSQTAQAGQGETVDLKTLKAIFFLQDSAPATEPGMAPPKPTVATQRRRLEVIFQDKERLEGSTEGYSKDRLGFFMVPEDPTGKILRVFVINRNVKEVKWMPVSGAAPVPTPTPSS
jgi:Family of unknown function (DUF6982)